MKTVKRKWAVLAVFGLLLMCAPAAVTAQTAEAVQPMAVYISGSDADLLISDNGVARVQAFVRGKSGTTSTYVQAVLQVKSGTTWLSTKSWAKTSSSAYVSINETYPVPKGTYRVVATVKADTESRTITTASKTY